MIQIAKTQKCPKYLSIGEWIKKMWYIYTMEYYSAIKKNEIMPFAAIWMDLGGTMLSEISQTEKDKYCMISLACGILKIQQTSEYNKRRNRLADT